MKIVNMPPKPPEPVDPDHVIRHARKLADAMIADQKIFHDFWLLCSDGQQICTAGGNPAIWQLVGQRINEAACGISLGSARSSEAIRAMLNGWEPPQPPKKADAPKPVAAQASE